MECPWTTGPRNHRSQGTFRTSKTGAKTTGRKKNNRRGIEGPENGKTDLSLRNDVVHEGDRLKIRSRASPGGHQSNRQRIVRRAMRKGRQRVRRPERALLSGVGARPGIVKLACRCQHPATVGFRQLGASRREGVGKTAQDRVGEGTRVGKPGVGWHIARTGDLWPKSERNQTAIKNL